MFAGRKIVAVPLLFAVVIAPWVASGLSAEEMGAFAGPGEGDPGLEVGRRMYIDGILPTGETMTGIVQGDIRLTGEQVICGRCHRRSGIGSTEGQDVVPAVTGDLLYNPLRLPTSKPPLAPELRPAYTDESLKRAIRDGIRSDGKPFGPLMPRYPLSDEQLDVLLAYLKSMTTDPHPGVDEKDIHFATIVSDAIDGETRKALLDVLEAYFKQRNVETRNESQRAEHAPWHKAWLFEPYRKWVLHLWELEGPAESWPEQLQARYEEQPVFALISGLAPGSWRPIHDFCEAYQVPCLFPNTDLPVVKESDFYSVYFTRGMALEADTVAQHLSDDRLISAPVVQVYSAGDPRAQAAAARLRDQVDRQGGRVTDFILNRSSALTDGIWRSLLNDAEGGTAVLWLGSAELGGLWTQWPSTDGGGPQRIYLSTSLYGTEARMIPPELRAQVYLVHPYELPSRLPRLLVRSSGWMKSQRIGSPDAQRIQANAFYGLKMLGKGLQQMRGFFNRDYLLERIEHMTENATYTSVYPSVSLAPGQRFVSRGAYIARFKPDGSGELVAVTDWLVPGSK